MAESGVTLEEFTEGLHERQEPLLAHVRDHAVPAASLIEERHRARLHGVGLERSIQAARFARRPEKGEQRVRDRAEQEEPIASGRDADVSRREAHAEVVVLHVTEGLLDGEALRVEFHDPLCAKVHAVGRDAPGLLHARTRSANHVGTGPG